MAHSSPCEGDSLLVASCTGTSQNTFQGRRCWTSKDGEGACSLMPAQVLGLSPGSPGAKSCAPCAGPHYTVLPSGHGEETLQTWGPLFLWQQQESTGGSRNQLWCLFLNATICTSPPPRSHICSCTIPAPICNIIILRINKKTLFFSRLAMQCECHKHTKRSKASIQSTDHFNVKSVL